MNQHLKTFLQAGGLIIFILACCSFIGLCIRWFNLLRRYIARRLRRRAAARGEVQEGGNRQGGENADVEQGFHRSLTQLRDRALRDENELVRTLSGNTLVPPPRVYRILGL